MIENTNKRWCRADRLPKHLVLLVGWWWRGVGWDGGAFGRGRGDPLLCLFLGCVGTAPVLLAFAWDAALRGIYRKKENKHSQVK